MKTTAQKISVMQAYEDGKIIEIKSSQGVFYKKFKDEDGELEWDWCRNDYRIVEEPQRVPFDGCDAFNLTLQKFKHKKDEDKFDTSICTRADSLGAYLNGTFTSYFELAQYWLKWNDLLKVWEECSKVK